MSDPTTEAPAQAQALARPESAVGKLRGFLEGRSKHLEQWCKGRINPAALIRFTLLDYSQSPKLQQCTPDSIYLALLACAQLGLEPGKLKQQCFIVPYGGEAQFQMGYRGYIALAARQELHLGSQLVYENDELAGLDIGPHAHVKHAPARLDRGALEAAYAWAHGGALVSTRIEWMSKKDLEQVKAHAIRGSRRTPAWDEWEDQMHRKAPIRRLGKYLPLGEEWATAAALEDSAGDTTEYRSTLEAVGVAETPEETPPPEGGRLDRALKKR